MKEPRIAVVGIDPSSRLVACVTTIHGRPEVQTKQIFLPPKKEARTCQLAYMGFRKYLKTLDAERIYVYIEKPTFVAKAGAGSLIPQAQVNGALLAACNGSRVFEVVNVSIGDWKKRVLGKGNASKAQIKKWCRDNWRNAYDAADGIQDLYDAAGLNRWGDMQVTQILRYEKGGNHGFQA